jgi:hypothetical protein
MQLCPTRSLQDQWPTLRMYMGVCTAGLQLALSFPMATPGPTHNLLRYSDMLSTESPQKRHVSVDYCTELSPGCHLPHTTTTRKQNEADGDRSAEILNLPTMGCVKCPIYHSAHLLVCVSLEAWVVGPDLEFQPQVPMPGHTTLQLIPQFMHPRYSYIHPTTTAPEVTDDKQHYDGLLAHNVTCDLLKPLTYSIVSLPAG